MDTERFFSYAIIKCADDARDEALNVGVLAFDSLTSEVALRATTDYTRIEDCLPGVSVRHVQSLLAAAKQNLPDIVRESGVEALARAHDEWTSTLRISAVRSILGYELSSVTDQLFARYITVQRAPRPAPVRGVPHTARVIRSVRTRLQRLGYEPGKDFRENAEIEGKTRSDYSVPVWYPLQVKDLIMVDAMEIHAMDERRTLDDARLIAQKVEQTLRANGATPIAVILKAAGAPELGEAAREIISSEGQVTRAGAHVYTYESGAELDAVARQLQLVQTSAL